MKRGDLIQPTNLRNHSDFIYVVLDEVMDPRDGMMNFVLMGLDGNTREWCSAQIRKVYRVVQSYTGE